MRKYHSTKHRRDEQEGGERRDAKTETNCKILRSKRKHSPHFRAPPTLPSFPSPLLFFNFSWFSHYSTLSLSLSPRNMPYLNFPCSHISHCQSKLIPCLLRLIGYGFPPTIDTTMNIPCKCYSMGFLESFQACGAFFYAID